MNTTELDQSIEQKMRAAKVAPPTINAFLRAVHQVISGERGMLPEASIDAVTTLPALDAIDAGAASQALLEKLVVIKLNGGLGTSMGLDRAKSLIPVKGQDTFMDFIARQVLYLRHDKDKPAF